MTERHPSPTAFEQAAGSAPTVSVVIPAYNEAGYIRACLESLLKSAGGIPLEILVLDGMSSDGTRAIVEAVGHEHPNVRLLDNPEKTVPYAMNRGIRAARGAVVIRVDGHALVAPDFIEACLDELAAHPECACVGGYLENLHDGEAAAAISLAMSSPFGVGNARFRLGSYEGYVDTLAFGAYRKAALEQVGLFDEVLTRNQDDELNFRLLKAGYKIWLSQRIRSQYYVRSSYPKLFRQYYQYGYWKVYVNQKHRTVTNLRQLAPVVLIAYAALGLLAALLLPALWSFYLAGLGLYLTLGAWVAFRKGGRLGWRMLLAFWTLHVGYGLGYLEGLVHFVLLRQRPSLKHARVSR